MTLRDLAPTFTSPRVDVKNTEAHELDDGSTALHMQSGPSPTAVTLAALHGLAAELDRDGTRVRGAFAPFYRSARTVTMASPPPESSTSPGFVGRFTLPTTDNDGTPFPTSVFVALFRELYEQHGGASFSDVTGIWRSEDGSCYVDRSIAIEVWTSDPAALVRFVEQARRALRQDCIPLRLERPKFVWVAGPEEVPS